MKVYILIRESVPVGDAVRAAAHASLACYLKFQHAPETATWLSRPFYKVICKVNDAEFEQAKSFADAVILTESALGGQEVAIAFNPRQEWPKRFEYHRLFR